MPRVVQASSFSSRSRLRIGLCLVITLFSLDLAYAGGQPEPTPSTYTRTISIGVFDRGQIPPEEGSMEDNRWTMALQELMGRETKLVFRAYPRREALDQWGVELAVGRAPDFMSTYWGAWIQQQAYAGHAVRLDTVLMRHAPEYVDYVGYEFIERYGSIENHSRLDDGIYLLPSRRAHTGQDFLWVRADWLDAVGLAMPRTAAELEEVARRFVQNDPDGNGVDDTAGLALTHRLIDLVFAAYGIKYGSVAMPYNVLNGTVVLAHEMPGFWDAVSFMRRLYDAGLVDPGIVRAGYDRQVDELALSGRLGIFARNSNWGSDLTAAARQDDPGARWTIAPLFESERFGRHPYLETFEASLTGFVNRTAENPDEVLRYVNLQANPEVQALLTHGVEGVHVRYENGVPVEVDPARNEREQYYASSSSYVILRGPSIDSPETARRWASHAVSPVAAEGYLLEALALEHLDEPYPYRRYQLPVYMPSTSANHESLRTGLESLVIKAIVGGDEFSMADAIDELTDVLGENRYADVKWELNEFTDSSDLR